MKSQLVSNGFRGTYPLYKERGETLAVLLERFRIERNLAPDTKLTYAGRLDPMAEGVVLVLAGEDRFQKDKLLGLEKTYTVDVLLGIGSDTHDPLGIVTDPVSKDISESEIKEIVQKMHTITQLPYPMYSSVPVKGQALFVHARAGREVDIPIKNVHIKQVMLKSIKNREVKDLATDAIRDIEKVVGDFRQQEIIGRWVEIASKYSNIALPVIQLTITASSGTYMRSLAAWMGEQLGVPAMAYRIIRTAIGSYSVGNGK